LNAYVPSGPAVVAAVAALVVATLLVAGGLPRIGGAAARAGGWLLAFASVSSIHHATLAEAPGFRMLALIAGLFYAMKAIVSVEAARLGVELPLGRWLAFATLWPGMRPALFERRRPALDAAPLLRAGLLRAAFGGLLVAAARLLWTATGSRALATLLLLPGLSLLLHFGAFNLIAGAWRLLGVDCGPLFKSPLSATSLSEFWGRRWNLAFSEMTSLAVYRPVTSLAGKPAALLAAFLLSGLLHEVAISLPVRAGAGGPLCYFALHGVLVLIEKRRNRGLGQLATLAALAAPLPLLFHEPFLRGVLWPLLE
jgi:alginate O-acetyltransferase complex protein AlgI